jgi:hypothetical protein
LFILACASALPSNNDKTKLDRPAPINRNLPGENASKDIPKVTLLKDETSTIKSKQRRDVHVPYHPEVQGSRSYREVQNPQTVLNNQQPNPVNNNNKNQQSTKSQSVNPVAQSQPSRTQRDAPKNDVLDTSERQADGSKPRKRNHYAKSVGSSPPVQQPAAQSSRTQRDV